MAWQLGRTGVYTGASYVRMNVSILYMQCGVGFPGSLAGSDSGSTLSPG